MSFGPAPVTALTSGTLSGPTLLPCSLAGARNETSLTSLTTYLGGTFSPLAGSGSITTVGTLVAGSIPYSLLTGTPAPSSGHDPTASVGLAAVPGSAGTWLRSDGAPALSQGIAPTWTGVHSFAPAARTSGSAPYLTITAPADTGLTAGTEAVGVSFLGATRQHATGAIATQSEYVFAAPTYSFAGASTIATASTVTIAGPPAAGANATITTPLALRVLAGNVSFGGMLASGTINVANWQLTSAGVLNSSTLAGFDGATLVPSAGGPLTLQGRGGTTGVVLTNGGNGGSFAPVTCLIAGAAGSAASTALGVRGVASQTAALVQLQGESSTTAGRPQADIDTAWAVSTDATRSADLVLRAYYTTTAREGLRVRGGSADVQIGVYGVTPVSRQLLATGALHTVDDVITALQAVGLVRQS